MSIFLDFGNVSTQLTAATAATLNNVLTAFESLSFFNKGISAQNVCTNLEYEMYPLLVKYQLEHARNEVNAPALEEYNVWAQEGFTDFIQEVSALELYDASIHSKITTSKTTYDTLYTAQFANIGTLNTNLVKQNQKSLVDLDTFQKSITSTLNTSNQALTLRQSITNRLITDLTPVSVPISKARLNTFIERNANTLLHLTTAVNGITAEIQSAKLLINNNFSTLNTTYKTLSSRLKAENTAITTNVNSYTRNAINTAVRLRFTGIGNGTNGVLGYRYTAGKITNGNLTIGGVTFVFRKGLATRNNLLCNGWLGGVYYVDGFSTTLPNTGTGYWNNWDYTNGIKLQGSFSTGYYNRIPGVSSLKTIPPCIVSQAKDNKKWYNYFPNEITDLNKLGKFGINFHVNPYYIPHITGTMSDNYQRVYGSFWSNSAYEQLYTKTPYDNDINVAGDADSVDQYTSFSQYYSYLTQLEFVLKGFFDSVKYCQTKLTDLLVAVATATGASRQTIINSKYSSFHTARGDLGGYFRRTVSVWFNDYKTNEFLFPYIYHNNFSEYSFTDSVTSSFMDTNLPLSPINISAMSEFVTLLGNGHGGNYQGIPSSALSGIRGVSHTLAEVISGDTLGDGSNQGLKPIIDKIIDTHYPTMTQRLVTKLSTLCVAFSTTAPAPAYAEGFIFLSGGSERQIFEPWHDERFLRDFTCYLSSWKAFEVDSFGDPQLFTGTYTTIVIQDTQTGLPYVSGHYDVNFENGTYVFAPSTDGGGGVEPEPDMTEPERGVTTSLNADYNLYTSKGFKIYSLIRKNTVFNDDAINTIKDAIDFLAFTLRHSKVGDVEMPTILYKPSIDDYIDNPLTSTTNDGYVLLIDELNENSPTLGAASFTHVRELGETIIENTDSRLLPQAGYFFLNNFYYNYLSATDLLNRSLLYNVVLHELFHAFGVGTSWFLENWNLPGDNLYRSYIVGVGETHTGSIYNSEYGNLGNVFYSTYDDGTRIETDFGTEPVLGRGDASYPTAFGVARSTLNDVGSAVKFYSEYFNTHITPTITNNLILTAIPVENYMGGGSFGCHWAEGTNRIDSYSSQGFDNRYITASTHPAPALFDELMTPISEDPELSVTPITKISLGALYDVGWVVDTSLADEWLPTTHILKYSTLNFAVSVNMYCTGGHLDATDQGELGFLALPFRPGVSYTFVNDPIESSESNYRLTLIDLEMLYDETLISLSSDWDEQWVTSSTSQHYKEKGMLTFKIPLTSSNIVFGVVAYDPTVGLPTNFSYGNEKIILGTSTSYTM